MVFTVQVGGGISLLCGGYEVDIWRFCSLVVFSGPLSFGSVLFFVCWGWFDFCLYLVLVFGWFFLVFWLGVWGAVLVWYGLSLVLCFVLSCFSRVDV